MNKARSVVTSALELRQKAGLKVRQPLSSLTITEEFTREVLEIIKDEMNVKEIKVGSEISLDTNLTPELKSEGLAREIIRAIQDIRKKENLNPSDRIEIIISTDDKIKNVFETYEEMIKSVTLVSDIKYSAEMQIHSASLEGSPFSVSLAR
jgi:isoleucyl-tRNA synthetase